MFENLRMRLALAMAPTKGAGDMTSGITPMFGGTPVSRGTRELLSLYGTSPWLRAIVHKIGFSVAETRWQLFVMRDENGRAVRNKAVQYSPQVPRNKAIHRFVDQNVMQEVVDHPLLDMLTVGNAELMGFNCMQVTQEHMDLVGEAFWLFERNGLGLPMATWPLPPNWVKEFPSARSPWWVVSDERSGGASGATHVRIPKEDIMFFRDPNPANPYGRGQGTGKSLGDELEIDEYAAKHEKAFFYNRARPDLIIHGENIQRDDTKRLEEMWLAKAQGFMKAFKPLFLNRKVEITELTQSFEDSQMIQLRKAERDTFISVFGAPPEKLGVLSQSNRSTIGAADYLWTKDVIQPRLELLRHTMQTKLVPMFDERLVLHYETPVVEDEAFRLNVMKAAPNAFTLNEWRAKADIESLGEFGDQLTMALNEELVPIPDEDSGKQKPPDNVIDLGSITASIADTVAGRIPEVRRKVIHRVLAKQGKA